MAFVNIYKLSDYIKEKTDALLARYGHVNALAEIIAPTVGTYDVQSSTAANINVSLNTRAGIIQNVNILYCTRTHYIYFYQFSADNIQSCKI